jgi:hypothetical protein
MDWSLSDAFSPGIVPATPLAAGTLGAGGEGGLFGDGITKRSGGNEFRIVYRAEVFVEVQKEKAVKKCASA